MVASLASSRGHEVAHILNMHHAQRMFQMCAILDECHCRNLSNRAEFLSCLLQCRGISPKDVCWLKGGPYHVGCKLAAALPCVNAQIARAHSPFVPLYARGPGLPLKRLGKDLF